MDGKQVRWRNFVSGYAMLIVFYCAYGNAKFL